MPVYVDKLKYGLNHISYISEMGNRSINFGHFDFVCNYEAKFQQKNLLKNGALRANFTITTQNTIILNTSDDFYGKNTICLISDKLRSCFQKTHVPC